MWQPVHRCHAQLFKWRLRSLPEARSGSNSLTNLPRRTSSSNSSAPMSPACSFCSCPPCYMASSTDATAPAACASTSRGRPTSICPARVSNLAKGAASKLHSCMHGAHSWVSVRYAAASQKDCQMMHISWDPLLGIHRACMNRNACIHSCREPAHSWDPLLGIHPPTAVRGPACMHAYSDIHRYRLPAGVLMHPLGGAAALLVVQTTAMRAFARPPSPLLPSC